ncbi:Methane monooxygenase component C [Rhodovastum atsumiense]|uniref:2Fe-2S iron-sulfur cluster binding domain-containing protein n=1 Tax=Rhodovastum atsumiense TaxID=504468 RepID=A0A5M6IRS7_9PROT|nr:2Fe-2S iron-sulfur cluster-binding protein [Rhodovastum atsumiense]KAA5610278.1 2Fe-2S iron-sulfur cluster binding domain-containing protein [Rhodovastum atsumiense]CAH2602235.1 Methane monooxygenase component C [Rhodovastum atsumiense]
MTQHQVDLLTRDGQSVRFDCAEDETLLDGAARASIFLPSVCRNGSCGACRVTRTGGEAVLDSCSDEALPTAARARGEVLLCRTRPLGDLALAAPFDHAAIQFEPVPVRNATVLACEDVGGATRRLLLGLEDDPAFGRAATFAPGQFMELGVPGTSLVRAYSLANTTNWDGHLEFLIRLQPGGRFSSWLRDAARPGERLLVRGPLGAFTLREGSLLPRFMVAGGTGLAPMLSMLRYLAECGDMTPTHLFFGVNRFEDLFGQDLLAELNQSLPALTVTPCVWQADPCWNGFVGTPVDALRGVLAHVPGGAEIYLCGPPGLVRAAEDAATQAGVPAEHIFSERFTPAVT